MEVIYDTKNGTSVTIGEPDVLQPIELSAVDFNKLCFDNLGGGATGMAAFQAVMDAATSAGGAAKACVTHYDKATSFVKTDVQEFFAILQALGCLTQNQSDAVLNNWPVA